MMTDFAGAAQFGGDAVLSFWKIGLLVEMVTGPLTAAALGLLPAAGRGSSGTFICRKSQNELPAPVLFVFLFCRLVRLPFSRTNKLTKSLLNVRLGK